MKNRKISNLSTLFLLFVNSISLRAEEAVLLRYIHREGEVLHADSLVDETVYVNSYLSHQAEIDEFSVSSVRQVDSSDTAVLDTSFRTVERINGVPGSLEWISSETVRLKRDSEGTMTVPEDASRPVLRNVPRFSARPVTIGDVWTDSGEEVHLFRINGNIYGPYRCDIQVRYEFLGYEFTDRQRQAVIGIEYDLYLPVRQRGEPIRLLTGRSSQELLWDVDKGRPVRKTEEFEFLMMMSNGQTQEFVGLGKTSYRYTGKLDRTNTVKSLEEDLQELPGLTVEATDEGVLLSLLETDRILFQPESAYISDDQRTRLEKLARILEVYTDRDILITGHTADYGTAEGRRILSRERASAVADILFPKGRTGSGRLFLRGNGSRESLGSDEANRRVDILILD